jgi:hypothetical protein
VFPRLFLEPRAAPDAATDIEFELFAKVVANVPPGHFAQADDELIHSYCQATSSPAVIEAFRHSDDATRSHVQFLGADIT